MAQDKKDFIDLNQFSKEELLSLLESCHDRKNSKKRSGHATVDDDQIGSGKILATIFEKPSTRTRFSFEVAMFQLGGKTINVSMNDMQLGRGETVQDTAKVLSRYVDLAMLRTLKHSTILDFAMNSTIPVINGLSNQSHPCQVLTDLMTVEEKLNSLDSKIFTWFGPANNMLNSWIHASDVLDFELRICAPEEYQVEDERIKGSKSNIIKISDVNEASKNSNCIITDTWFSMGEDYDPDKEKILEPYRVDKSKIEKADKDVIFLHCLPAHRGQEVEDDVIDGPQSVVWDEAENRVHAQKAIINWCLS